MKSMKVWRVNRVALRPTLTLNPNYLNPTSRPRLVREPTSSSDGATSR